MDFEDVRFQISEALRQFNSQQITLLMEWLEEVISKHRTNHSNFLPMKYNGGQCFACPCGRTFAIETTIRETTNVDASSPPATPMLQSKIDYKQLHSMSESNPKRPRILNVDANNLLIHNSQNNNIIAERINSSSILTSWPSSSIKTYENSPELIHVDPHQNESDIELSSDESRCLEDIEAVLTPNKEAMSNFMYSNDLWPNQAATPTIDDNHQGNSPQQMINLKSVNNEPMSPVTLVHDNDIHKSVVPIHRRPMLIAFNGSETCSPNRTTYFKCTQCHETFDTLLAGQEHANNGLCTPDTGVQNLESSDSQTSPLSSSLFESFHEDLEEPIPARCETKAACPVCKKIFSSVHTMMRHKTSIHDRQVRYECNICGRVFFRKDKLTSHMVYHQDFDSYVCCFCTSGFKSRMLMRQHLKREHVTNGEDTRLNDILNRCQIKKLPQTETNMTVSYGNDRSNIDSKRSTTTTITETDRKQSTMTINNN